MNDRIDPSALSAQDQELLSLERTSEILSICKTYVYKLINAGELRSVKIGRRSLVSRRALGEYLNKIGA